MVLVGAVRRVDRTAADPQRRRGARRFRAGQSVARPSAGEAVQLVGRPGKSRSHRGDVARSGSVSAAIRRRLAGWRRRNGRRICSPTMTPGRSSPSASPRAARFTPISAPSVISDRSAIPRSTRNSRTRASGLPSAGSRTRTAAGCWTRSRSRSAHMGTDPAQANVLQTRQVQIPGFLDLQPARDLGERWKCKNLPTYSSTEHAVLDRPDDRRRQGQPEMAEGQRRQGAGDQRALGRAQQLSQSRRVAGEAASIARGR